MLNHHIEPYKIIYVAVTWEKTYSLKGYISTLTMSTTIVKSTKLIADATTFWEEASSVGTGSGNTSDSGITYANLNCTIYWSAEINNMTPTVTDL
jgi:hypothetical protein